MAATIIDTLAVSLGFDFDPKGVEKFQKSMDRTKSIIKGVAAAFAAGSAAAIGFVTATTGVADAQGKMANEIGIGVGELDAWQHAAKLAGESSEGMSGSLSGLSVRLSEAKRGMGSALEVFGILGIDAMDAAGQLKSTSSIMMEVSSKFQDFSKMEQIEFAEKLGLSGSLRLLQQGPAVIQQYIADAKALGVTTAKDAKVAAEFQDNLTRLYRVVGDLARAITKELAPIMTTLTKRFLDWWRINRDIIMQKIPEVFEQATKYAKRFAVVLGLITAFSIINTLGAMIGGFGVLTMNIGSAAKAVGLLLKTLFTLPAVIVAGIAVLWLLAEDAKVFFRGGDSVIGDLIKKFPQWKNEIVALAAVFATIYDLGVMVKDGWKALIKVILNSSWDDVTQVVKDIPKVFLEMMKDVLGFAKSLLPEVFNIVNVGAEKFVDAFHFVKDAVLRVLDTITDFISGIIDQILSIPEKINEAFKNAAKGIKGVLSESLLGKAFSFFGAKDSSAVDSPDFLGTTIGSTTNNSSVYSPSKKDIRFENISITVNGAQTQELIVSDFQEQIEQALIDAQSNVWG